MIIEPTDYKANDIKGKQRVYGGSFSNVLEGIPSIVFDEEIITHDVVSDRVFHNQTGSISVALIDPSTPLTLRNPVDDTVIPIAAFIAKLTAQNTVTYEDEFILLYSLGRQAQIERDAALAVVS